MNRENHLATNVAGEKNDTVKMDEAPASFEEALQLYVGEKYDYYKRKWEKKGKNGDPSLSFNVAGFFGEYFWCAGRGMFLPVMILLIVLVIDDMIVVATGQSPLLSGRAPGFALLFLFGFTSNYFYYKRVIKKVKQLMSEERSRQYFVKAGGFRWSYFFIALGIVVIYVIASSILLADFYV